MLQKSFRLECEMRKIIHKRMTQLKKSRISTILANIIKAQYEVEKIRQKLFHNSIRNEIQQIVHCSIDYAKEQRRLYHRIFEYKPDNLIWLTQRSEALNEIANSNNCQFLIVKNGIELTGTKTDLERGERKINKALKRISESLMNELISEKQMCQVLKRMLKKADFKSKYNVQVEKIENEIEEFKQGDGLLDDSF